MTGLNVLAKHTAHDVQPLVCMCVCVCHLWIILGSFLVSYHGDMERMEGTTGGLDTHGTH